MSPICNIMAAGRESGDIYIEGWSAALALHPAGLPARWLIRKVEEGALPAQFLQPGVGDFIEGVELVEGLDQECAAAACQVENAETLQRFLPGFPEADEGLALRFVERGQVVGVGVGQRLAGGARGF